MENVIKLKSNRRTTRGRKIYFQKVVKKFFNQLGKAVYKNTSIKHIQVSQTRLLVAPLMMENMRKSSRNGSSKIMPGITIWDSMTQGTYLRSKHGEIGKRLKTV